MTCTQAVRLRKSPSRRAAIESLEGRTLLATVPANFADQSNFVTNLPSTATSMEFAPDGRLFLTLQTGQLRVVKNGRLLAAPFLTRAVDAAGERGLLGVTFDPDFANNGYVYVYYTVPGTPQVPVHNRISRFTAADADPGAGYTPGDTAVPNSEFVLMDLDRLSGATNHNGGAIHFGPDGKLYAATGENANPPNAQNMSNRHGKMLRINPDGSIPQDNPFYNTATGGNRAIWALGLRNPFTFAFQPGTGRMFINDVGDNGPDLEKWEEINEGRAGANYGWPNTGDGYFNAAQFPQFTNPIHAYNHTQGGRVITGGTFYNPAVQNFPSAYIGDYFFADFSGGFIRKLEAPQSGSRLPASPFATGVSGPVDLDVGPDGQLYYLARNSGRIGRIRFTGTLAPVIGTQPANDSVARGQTAEFTVGASGDGTLAYRWQRFSTEANEFADIPGATSATYTTPATTESDNGARFRVIVTNAFGSATSNEAVLTVVSNDPPVGTIVTPPEGTTFAAGETISFSGTATDPQDGDLPASAYTWEIYYYTTLDNGTGGVRRPYETIADVTSGSFVIADTGPYTNADVLYRIELVVEDSAGLTSRTTRDVLPRTSRVTLDTNVERLSLNLDGQPQAAPYTFTGVEWFKRLLEAPATQTLNGTTYEFVSWSDGGARSREIATPVDDTTFRAAYRPVTQPRVEVRRVFYNNSAYDGFDPAVNEADDDAIATDKAALLPGQAATFNNATGYVRGLNGIMIDVVDLLPDTPIGAGNFMFRTGAGDGTWEPAPAPTAIVVRGLPTGVLRSRVTVTWADEAIVDEWLEVTFSPVTDEPPGQGPIVVGDVFYFGNLRAETGDGENAEQAALRVTALDLAGTRAALNTGSAGVENNFDHNRDRRVNALDLAAVRRNLNREIDLFTAPPPPMAPAGFSTREINDLLA